MPSTLRRSAYPPLSLTTSRSAWEGRVGHSRRNGPSPRSEGPIGPPRRRCGAARSLRRRRSSGTPCRYRFPWKRERQVYIYIYIFSFFSSFGCFQLIACFRGREIDSRREEEEEEEDRRRRWRAEEKTFYK
jgi:hypothetical protein